MDKALVKERLQLQKCPYCGAERKDLLYGEVKTGGKEAFHEVACTLREKHFTEVYSFILSFLPTIREKTSELILMTESHFY